LALTRPTDRRTRLDPEVFRLPVQKLRDGYYTDAAQTPKEHDRCGSNLIAPMLLCTLAGNFVVRSLLRARGPVAGLGVALGSVALSVELFAWSERKRERPLARAFRRPGFEMQRMFATREPTPEQLEVGRAALAEILRLEVPGLGAH